MKIIFHWLSLIFIAASFTSCEGILKFDAKVINHENSEDIINAKMLVVECEQGIVDSSFSDSSGNIYYRHLVSCTPRCKDYGVRVIAHGFDTFKFNCSEIILFKDTTRVIKLKPKY